MEKGRVNKNDRLQIFMMKFVRKMSREENGTWITNTTSVLNVCTWFQIQK